MAARIAARYVSRRLSGSGKIFSEEEKAAENVYIKKVELEKLEKLARKGPQSETSTASATDANPSASTSSAEGASRDKNRNYVAIVGGVAALGALGWYLKGTGKKPEKVQD